MSLYTELKDRKVIRVAAVYLVVAWLIMQVVAVISAPLLLPDWFARVVILLLTIGFPLAIILSWAFDATPAENSDNRSGKPLAIGLIAATAVVIGFIVTGFNSGDAPEEVVAVEAVQEIAPLVVEVVQERLPNSVAVLPFENLSLDPEDAFFALGIHDTILNELANIRNMNVIARTTMLRYLDSDKSIPEIADELNVETIMEGSVQYAEGRVLVTAQLIDPSTNTHMWSENYEEPFANIFAIQAEIATQIAVALEAELLSTEQENIENNPTTSTEAYALFLKAKSLPIGAITGDANAASILDLLDSAIELDKDFALAYAWKARIYNREQSRESLVADGVLESMEKGTELAIQFLEQALILDPNLAQAHAQLANTLSRTNRELAWQQCDKAIELAPNDPEVLIICAWLLFTSGQFSEGIRIAERFANISPVWGNATLGSAHYWAGNYEVARDFVLQAIERDPTDSFFRLFLASIEIASDNYDGALEQLRLGERLLDGTVPAGGVISEFAYAYARAGSIDDAERFFSQIDEPRGAPLAHMQLVRGNINEALAILEEIADRQGSSGEVPLYEPNLGRLIWNAWKDPILDQPEFVAVRERLGFTDL